MQIKIQHDRINEQPQRDDMINMMEVDGFDNSHIENSCFILF